MYVSCEYVVMCVWVYLHMCVGAQNCCLEFFSVTPQLILRSQGLSLNPELTDVARWACLFQGSCHLSQNYRHASMPIQNFCGFLGI